ncbi:hypothetical protein HF896_11980 [Alicycliphilus denitrificans]|uniref:Uncharacterized protein n=1 Tax=Alicycliphilus denitrificans TaxID=179636 RepID=A0A858ZVL3_9BURK|nr:hypothetical protein [Alicycliphilus denitrificans]QKD44299.1 hypothetical protein HF896_11980 [Alicycliphilus denitrificans]
MVLTSQVTRMALPPISRQRSTSAPPIDISREAMRCPRSASASTAMRLVNDIEIS